MNFTRLMVATLIATAVGTLSAEAQGLQAEAAVAPAEFPPASFTGNQYVDSRGCIFIRAGIDGNVTWVPRVTRSRQLICGYQPSLGSQAAAAAASAPAAPVTPPRAPVEITLAPELRPTAAPQPETVAAAAPRYQPAAPAPQPQAAPRYQSQPQAPRYQPTPGYAAAQGAPRVASGGRCPDASPLSQQYINNSPDVRCGPQLEPQTLTPGRAAVQISTLQPYYPPGTRVVPRHVYDARQNTDDFTVPPGYRRVWTDDRLNPHRAEFTLAPAQISKVPYVSGGYRQMVRDDDRLNLQRGIRTEAGDAQTDMIWTKTVPRRLVKVPTDRPVVALPDSMIGKDAPVVRVSTRSAPVPSKTEFDGR